MLKETKTDSVHYFVDDRGRYQGEFKRWYANGQLCVHCFCVDDKFHGEYKAWYEDGTISANEFYVNGDLYRDLLKNPVDDQEKFMITLETGGGWLC
jgi:antitoxin component YwqK of YwqJK toxin-antitoxin module